MNMREYQLFLRPNLDKYVICFKAYSISCLMKQDLYSIQIKIGNINTLNTNGYYQSITYPNYVQKR